MACLQLADTFEVDQKWKEALTHVSSSPALWAHRLAFLLSLGPQLSLSTVLQCCVDSTMALARHAASIHAQAKRGTGAADKSAAPQQVSAGAQRAAELAVADAAVRHVALLLAIGQAGAALEPLQAATEWAAAPTVGVGAFPCSSH